jgi:hypothetical protein
MLAFLWQSFLEIKFIASNGLVGGRSAGFFHLSALRINSR